MALLYQINRGHDVSVPSTARKLRGFYNPIPLDQPTKHASIGREAQLFSQLRRGHKVPDPKARIVDHDIAETIAAQDHGMKIRIADPSLAVLGEQIKL